MLTYTVYDDLIVRSNGNVAWIPYDPGNRDYQGYLAWVAAGNTPIRIEGRFPVVPRKKPEVDALIEELAQRLNITPEELRAAVEARR